MKLYSFEYNDYGLSYHVMSDTKENALKAIVNYLKKKAISSGNRILTRSDGTTYLSCDWEEYEKWKKATIDKLPDEKFYKNSEHGKIYRTGYNIIEYGINKVIETSKD
ncbi:MAG: hypothetical protein HGB12_00300 [Bacteroidetes bacterium]|nr:hypothetical protein [Bacteroidota bacterium]